MFKIKGIRHYEKKDKQASKDNNGDVNFEEFYLNKNFKTTREALDIFINDQLMFEPGKKSSFILSLFRSAFYLRVNECN